jgi:hypothetical protein
MKRRERLSGSKHGKVSAFAQRQQPRGLINLGAGQAKRFAKSTNIHGYSQNEFA